MKLGFFETIILKDKAFLLIWYMHDNHPIQYPTHISLLEYCHEKNSE